MTKLTQRKRESGHKLVDLTSTNPTASIKTYPHQEIASALASVGDLTYRPEPLGLHEARQAIADLYQRGGLQMDPHRIAVTASTSEAYSGLFKLLCEPGHEVLVPLPSYPLFEYLAALECVRIVPYHLTYDGSWSVDFRDLESKITADTRAIVVVNPNNPTGSFLKAGESKRLLQLAEERNIPVISDEVFAEYSYTNDANRCTTLAHSGSALVFSLDGLSKMAGMPQMKLGWIVVSGGERSREDALRRLELILDTYLSVGTPVQLATRELLTIGNRIRTEIIRVAHRNLAALRGALADSPAHVLHTEGGWSAVVRLPNTRTEQDWTESILEQRDTIVQPGYFFDMPSEPYAVVSLITPPEIFAEGVSRLASHVC